MDTIDAVDDENIRCSQFHINTRMDSLVQECERWGFQLGDCKIHVRERLRHDCGSNYSCIEIPLDFSSEFAVRADYQGRSDR